MSSPSETLSILLSKPVSLCEIALKRCGHDQEAATDYILTNEDKPESFWAEIAKSSESDIVRFERWGENLEKVDEETLSEIAVKCVGEGVLFTDASFPPEYRSLYFDPSRARKHWKCHDCNRDNPMPTEQVLTQYRRQNPGEKEIRDFYQFIARTNPLMAQALQSNPNMAVQLMLQSYGHTGTIEPLVCSFCQGKFPLGILEAQPVVWLRPANIRDDITAQYGAGSPWKLIRDSVRSDDVRQGAVGNCWFLGALSILAHQKPDLLSKIFPFNQEFSESGAYLVRLCKDGLWRNVIVDDFLPCNRNAGLSYTAAARRQLWVPLIEKAAAKLFGCYEALHSGTLCEAFSLLTGFATEREMLTRDHFSTEEKQVLWARLVSAQSEGFLIGLACAPKNSITTKDLNDKGLQAPHAYIVMDTRELASGETLVQLGNPWGERSPSTWKGRWGNSSEEFLNAVSRKLLPKPLNELNSNGQFWIAFDDLIANFASIEFCRTASLLVEERLRGWLPAVTGLGDSFAIQTGAFVHGKIRFDVSLYQESHSLRAVSANIDLGFVVLKAKSAVSVFERKTLPEASLEIFLDPNADYLLVPLSFSNAYLEEHRKVVVALRTTESDHLRSVKRVPTSASLLRDACNAYCDFLPLEFKPIVPGLNYSVTKDPVGAIIRAENLTTCLRMEINFDADDSVNISSSRGALITKDVLAPGSSSICAVLTAKRGAQRYALWLSMAAGRMPNERIGSYFPPLAEGEDSPEIKAVHEAVPVRSDRLILLSDLCKMTSDASGVSVLMNLLIRFQNDVQRLTQEYIAAGIDPDDAERIAKEEAEHLYR